MRLEYTGSGNSKENAIYFNNASTFIDHIEMEREYIKQKNIKITNLRSFGEVTDKYLYDVYETSKGNIWFKVPNNIIE